MDTYSKPKVPARDLVCPNCGIAAACDCGMAPIDRAQCAVLKNPEKSSRAIAAEIGVGRKTVDRARAKATGPRGPVEKRIGKDGKARRLPKRRVQLQRKSRLLTTLNSVLRTSKQRVFETPYFEPEGFRRYRLSEYHHIDFASEVPAVVNHDVDLEKLGRELGVLSPQGDFFEGKETANA
jgi:hypothetical protein